MFTVRSYLLVLILSVTIPWLLVGSASARHTRAIGTLSIPLTYGGHAEASIDSSGDVDVYTFEGSAGDLVLIRVQRTSGTFFPDLKLFAPNDSLVKEIWGSSSAKIVDYSLPYSGTYTVTASDYLETETGDYWLTLQCRQEIKARADAISYDSFTDSLSVGPYGDMDGYVFEGNAGDLVVIQMHRTSGTFYPKLELFAPNDSLVREVWTTGAHDKIVDYSLPYSGTYTIFSSDYVGDKTGDYWLTLQCRQDVKAKAGLITYDSCSDSLSISPYGDMDAYAFEGEAGDLVIIQVHRTSGTFYPELELFAPNDSLVEETWGGSHEDIVDYSLPYSGTYTVFASDYVGDKTGEYWLTLQCRQDVKAGADTVAYRSYTDSLSISPYGDMDAYVFDGNVGDLVIIQMYRTSGTLSPKLELFAPNDSLVMQASGSTMGKIADYPLPYSGTYTVFARDNVGDKTGEYWLALQCRQDVKARADTIAYDSLSDSLSIDPCGDMDAYVFEGSAGDVVIIQMHRMTGTFYPRLELFAPNDSLVMGTGGSTDEKISDYPLPYSGTYTVFASDNVGDKTGEYWLALQCRQDVKAKADTIAYDSLSDSLSISPYGDMDAYVFEGSAGDIVIIQMHRTAGTLYPRLELFAPNDSVLMEAWGGTSAKLSDYTLSSSGTYTVFASDNAGDKTGDYWLTLQCRQEVKARADTLTGEQGAIVRSLEKCGSMKAYIFPVNTDDTTKVQMLKSSGEINPCVELYGPSDTLITAAHGYSEAEISDQNFAESGIYTIFVSDYEGDGTGSYQLSWNGFLDALIDVDLPRQTVPARYRVYQSYPNPFNPLCTIRFELPEACRVELKVFDVSGSSVRTLVDGWREPGLYSVVWDGRRDDGSELASGVYFYSIKAGKSVVARKAVLLK